MNPWLETLGVILVAAAGIGLGRTFSVLRKPYWVLGYILPAVLICALIAVRCTSSLAFVPPLLWMTAHRAKFVILAFAVTTGLTTPMSRLPRKFEKCVICALMVVVVVWFSILPFLVPAFIKDDLSNLRMRFDSNGICFQTTNYTCAPAAAVTALQKLGLHAHEGELAVLSHTSPIAGTLPGCLEAALQNRYGADGLKCRYRHFNSLDELRSAGITLAVVRDAFLSDHCVAVLGVSDQAVILADPIAGKQLMSHRQFESVWRFTGIVLKRDVAQSKST
ncbi:MAG TPA: cysteine peptidase family C39 domain-containing protein [Sedimentisphaerales bacterium]|nr:cysteine peptidase family C39 domain-containing protein [Sedimentisphaerales bacterium]